LLRRLAAEFDIRIEALRLQDILAKLGIEGEGFGGIDGRIRLRGRGTSVDKLVGSADGQAALTVDGGAIDALIIEAIGLDIAESILVLLDRSGRPRRIRRRSVVRSSIWSSRGASRPRARS
jgi:uncharacterized protein involved in outer membrane biogenesis